MAEWPSTLPAPSAGGYAVNPVDPVIRTEMEGGNVRTRRRTTARLDKVQATWKFTDAEMDTFRAWFDLSTGANGGADWFTISLPTGDGGFSSVSARFGGVFSAKMLSAHLRWEVSAVLEVRYA